MKASEIQLKISYPTREMDSPFLWRSTGKIMKFSIGRGSIVCP